MLPGQRPARERGLETEKSRALADRWKKSLEGIQKLFWLAFKCVMWFSVLQQFCLPNYFWLKLVLKLVCLPWTHRLSLHPEAGSLKTLHSGSFHYPSGIACPPPKAQETRLPCLSPLPPSPSSLPIPGTFAESASSCLALGTPGTLRQEGQL